MALTKQQLQQMDADLGSSSQQPQAQQQSSAPQPGGLMGFFRNASKALRGFNAGIVPDAAAAIQMGGQFALGQRGNQLNNNNWFISPEQLAQKRQEGVLMDASKNTAGAASYIPGLQGEGALARFGLGSLQGGLQGYSQDGANPRSVATAAVTNGVLNTVLPGVSNLFQSGLGRTALGKGGDKFGDLVRQGGGIYGATPEQIAKGVKNNSLNSVMPNLEDIINNSGNTPFTKSRLFGTRAVASGTIQDGLMKDILHGVPASSEGQVQEFLGKTLPDVLDRIHTEYLSNAGVPDEHILPIVQNKEAEIPAPVMDEFMHKLGLDAYSTNALKPAVRQPAQNMWGAMRGDVADAMSNPSEYNRLKGLSAAASNMSNSLAKDGSSKMEKLANIGTTISLPVGLGLSLLSANPVPAMVSAGAKVANNPVLAANTISAMNSPLARFLGALTRRGATNVVSSTQTTP
jgi:hypothetical protein